MQPREKFDTGVDAGRNDAARTSNGSTTDSGIRGPQKSDKGACGPPSDSSPKAGLFARALVGALARRAGVLPVLAFFALALWAVEGQAQTAVAVCSNTPVAGERIECTEDTTSTSDIDIDAVDVDIDTSVENESGIHAKHEGAGKIDVEVRSDTAGTIDTAGINAHGIHSEHTGTGDITINVQKTKITTTGDDANGVYVEHTGDGNINIDVLDGSNIDIQGGGDEYAIRAEHDGDGDIDVLVDDTTTNNFIEIVHFGVGASTVRVENSTIDSDQNKGIINQHNHTSNDPLKNGRTDSNTYVIDTDITLSGDRGPAVYGEISDKSTEGDVLVDVDGAMIVTTGLSTIGVRGSNRADVGDVRINVRNSTVDSVFTGIFAERAAGGRGAINLDVRDTEVTTTGIGGFGIHVSNGSENATADDVQKIFVENATITTKGHTGFGIFSNHQSVGDIDIDVLNPTITTQGSTAHGILAYHYDIGDIDIDVLNPTIVMQSTDISSLNPLGTLSFGIYASHRNSNLASTPVELGGNVDINVQGGSIETHGSYSYGIRGDLEAGNGGEIKIETGGGNTVTTTGDNAHGIVAYHYGTAEDTSTISIVVGGSVDTTGAGAQGVRVGALSSGAPARVAAIGADDYRRQTVTVNGAVMGNAAGVFLAGGGRVVIGPEGSIASESGIAILAKGDTPGDGGNPIKPKLRVDMNLGGRRVEQAIGDDWIINDGGETTIAVNSVVLHNGAKGVTDAVARNGAWNVRMREEGVNVVDYTMDPDPANWEMIVPTAGVVVDRDFSAQDFNETARPRPRPPRPPPPPPTCPAGQTGTPPNCATPPPPTPTPETVMVNERVFGGMGEEAGVHLPGGGTVVIGPEGSIRAQSGIAILATGDAPQLLVDMNLGGRRDVIGSEGSIRAQSGIVNLAAEGVPQLLVDMNLDGRRVEDVIGDDWIINDGGETTIVVNGVTLHDGPTGVVPDTVAPNGAWNVTMREEGVTVDRSDPNAWVITEPTAGVVADRDFSTADFIETTTTVEPEPKPLVFMEEYAPRAAVYEALPGFLLKLNGGGPAGERVTSPGSPVWARLSGSRGSHSPDHSTVGQDYDFERSAAEAGMDVSLGESFTGSISLIHVRGSAEVSSPFGGGDIEAEGLGVSIGASWRIEGGYYANGNLSLTDYDVDATSGDSNVGTLKRGAFARGTLLNLEAGRRIEMSKRLNLTPRAWMTRSGVSIDTFTDSVDARVSAAETARFTGGVGAVAETARAIEDGSLSLRGSVDLEQKLDDAETAVDVSGTRLESKSQKTRLLLGLGGVYRKGRFSVSGEVSMGGLGSDDTKYAGQLSFGMRF